MTKNAIKHAVETCPWRSDCENHEEDMRWVICRLMCLPCLRVIETGQCSTLTELSEKEGEQE